MYWSYTIHHYANVEALGRFMVKFIGANDKNYTGVSVKSSYKGVVHMCLWH